MTATLSAPTVLLFHPDDDQAYSLNFTQFGIGDRKIQTVNAITATPSGLSFVALQPNAATIKGERQQTVEIGKAATWQMTGGAVGTDYTLTVRVTYDDGSVVNAPLLARCRAR